MIRYFISKLCLAVFLIAIIFHVANACDVIDDTGQVIHLQRPAKRIISLAPDLTEILFAVGAGSRIIGVMQGSDYPLSAKNITIIANYNSLDFEKIMAFRPDLIVTWTEVSYLPQLKKLNIPIYFSRQKKITDIPNTMHKLACLTGYEARGKIAEDLFMHRYQQLQQRYTGRKPMIVFYQVWPRPLMTITKNSWINDIITLCGGKNIFADLPGSAPEVSLEAVISANPDIIVGSDLQNWHAWPNLKAVKNKQLYPIESDLVERAGPRLIEGAEKVCTSLHSGEYSG